MDFSFLLSSLQTVTKLKLVELITFILVIVTRKRTKLFYFVWKEENFTCMGTLNICRGISSFSFCVKALPTPYAWGK